MHAGENELRCARYRQHLYREKQDDSNLRPKSASICTRRHGLEENNSETLANKKSYIQGLHELTVSKEKHYPIPRVQQNRHNKQERPWKHIFDEDTRKELKDTKKRLNDIQTFADHLEEENETLNSECSGLEAELEQYKYDYTELLDTYGKLKISTEEYKKKLDICHEQLSEVFTVAKVKIADTEKRFSDAISRSQQENSDLKRDVEYVTKENDQLKLKVITLQDEKETYTSDLDYLRLQLQCKEKEISDCKQQLQKNEDNTKTAHERQITNLKNKADQLESDNVDLKTKFIEMKDELQNQLRHKENELKETKRDLDNTIHRHTQREDKQQKPEQANGNFPTAELSDIHRPSRLAVQFQELYDEQWSEAFESLEEAGVKEKQIIHTLLNIITNTRQLCDKESKEQIDEIHRVITQSDQVRQRGLPDTVMEYIKDCRKASVTDTSTKLYEKYRRMLSCGSNTSPMLADYKKECFKICWLMAIQDQPIMFAPEPKCGDVFRQDHYTPYTVTGTTVDYLVWPALLLHENGALLCKGVLQAQCPSGDEVGGRKKVSHRWKVLPGRQVLGGGGAMF